VLDEHDRGVIARPDLVREAAQVVEREPGGAGEGVQGR
jgi:hypothetical protein